MRFLLLLLVVGAIAAGAGVAIHDQPVILTRHVDGDGWIALNVTISTGSLTVWTVPSDCSSTRFAHGVFERGPEGPQAWLMGRGSSGGVALEPPFIAHRVGVHVDGFELEHGGEPCDGGAIGVGIGPVSRKVTLTFGTWFTSNADTLEFRVTGTDATIHGVTTGPAHGLAPEDFDGTLRADASTLVSSHAVAFDTEASFTTADSTLGFVWGDGDIVVAGPGGTSACSCTWWDAGPPGEHVVRWTNLEGGSITVSVADIVLPP